MRNKIVVKRGSEEFWVMKPRVQLYYDKEQDTWTAKTNIPNLKIDMDVDDKTAFYPNLPLKVEVS